VRQSLGANVDNGEKRSFCERSRLKRFYLFLTKYGGQLFCKNSRIKPLANASFEQNASSGPAIHAAIAEKCRRWTLAIFTVSVMPTGIIRPYGWNSRRKRRIKAE